MMRSLMPPALDFPTLRTNDCDGSDKSYGSHSRSTSAGSLSSPFGDSDRESPVKNSLRRTDRRSPFQPGICFGALPGLGLEMETGSPMSLDVFTSSPFSDRSFFFSPVMSPICMKDTEGFVDLDQSSQKAQMRSCLPPPGLTHRDLLPPQRAPPGLEPPPGLAVPLGLELAPVPVPVRASTGVERPKMTPPPGVWVISPKYMAMPPPPAFEPQVVMSPHLLMQPQMAVPPPPAMAPSMMMMPPPPPFECAPVLEEIFVPPAPATFTDDWTNCALNVSQVSEDGSDDSELPSVGSAGHKFGTCRPCTFVRAKGCENGINCAFCHLCEKGEKKRRKKARVQQRKLEKDLEEILDEEE